MNSKKDSKKKGKETTTKSSKKAVPSSNVNNADGSTSATTPRTTAEASTIRRSIRSNLSRPIYFSTHPSTSKQIEARRKNVQFAQIGKKLKSQRESERIRKLKKAAANRKKQIIKRRSVM